MLQAEVSKISLGAQTRQTRATLELDHPTYLYLLIYSYLVHVWDDAFFFTHFLIDVSCLILSSFHVQIFAS